MFVAYTGTYNDLCHIIRYFRKLQAPRSALVCGATCGMHVFAGFVDKFFGHFRPEIGYSARQSASRNLYKMLPIYSSSIWHKAFDAPCLADIYNLTKSPTAKSLTGTLQRIRSRARDTALQSVVEDMKTILYWWEMPTRWHMMSEKQLSILIQGRNYARGNRQIIRIPRAFACISAGAPWLWRSVMQIDKVSQEPARLRMLTAPFHGTFFSIGSS